MEVAGASLLTDIDAGGTRAGSRLVGGGVDTRNSFAGRISEVSLARLRKSCPTGVPG